MRKNMAVLLTRPHPDNEATERLLRARGHDVVLAPMLRLEPMSSLDAADTANYGAVIVTSANALRAVEGQLAGSPLLKLPLFAVGEHTASVARHLGFAEVISADGDAADLRERVLASANSCLTGKLRSSSTVIIVSPTSPVAPTTATLNPSPAVLPLMCVRCAFSRIQMIGVGDFTSRFCARCRR